MQDSIKIFGDKTVKKWKEFRTELIQNWCDIGLWEKAYNDYLFQRLETRYLDPINEIRKMKRYKGEGFSIVALLCTLIEFLESLYQGKVYKHGKEWFPGFKKFFCCENSNKFVYNNDRKMFVSFLTKRDPFNKVFNNNRAKEFYTYIRCGLVHEAYTKKAWVIRANNKNEMLEKKEEHGKVLKVIDRNKFHDAFKQFLEKYKCHLLICDERKKAFIRKMNGLCQLPILEGIESL